MEYIKKQKELRQQMATPEYRQNQLRQLRAENQELKDKRKLTDDIKT